MYVAHVRITLRPSILDPQGKALEHALGSLGHTAITQVRSGKLFTLHIDAPDAATAEQTARTACERLLANPVMENYEIAVEAVGQPA